MPELSCSAECPCHVNPYDYVPCCPRHHLPLRAAEAGHGQCPWVSQVPARRGTAANSHVGGTPMPAVVNRCITYGPDAWVWLPRDTFNASDLPPLNGDEPPRLPKVGEPWARYEHHCRPCEARTLHVEGQNRRVCTACGNAAWVPTPAYVEAMTW